MAKVKNVESSKDLLLLLEKSSLLAEEKLQSAQQICGANDDPKAAARQLLKTGLLTNWQANQLLGGFSALIIGSYKLLDQIGKGELGRVYLAEDSKTGNKVALKVLSSKSASEPKMVERFLAEAKAAGAFDHRNVLRVLDVSSDEDRPFVVTEFVSGGDLQQRIDKNGPLPSRDAADLITQAAEGMSYVHAKDVLHRNLKPANLLVDDNGVLKILDVGVGQLRQADKPGNESTGELLLSALGYMAPEQIRGKDLDVRSDIYALGGTLYFLLSGRVPYTATSNEERDIIRKTKRPVPITTLKSDIPTELATLCDQMMALKALDRPASMDAVAQRLRAFLKDESAVAESEVAETSPDTTPIAQPSATKATESETLSVENRVKTAAITSPVPASGTEPAVPGDDVKIQIGGEDAVPRPATVPAGFKIQKKKKAEIAEAITTGAASNDSALVAVAKKAKRQRLILITSAAVSLLIIIVGVAAMMMPSGNEASQVAVNSDSAGTAGASTEGSQANKQPTGPLDANDPENIPDPETIPDPAAPTATTNATPVATTPSPATSAVATPTSPAAPAPAAPAVAASEPSAIASATTTPPASTSPPVGTTPPAANAVATSNPAAPAAATPAPTPAPAAAPVDPATPTAVPAPSDTAAPSTPPEAKKEEPKKEDAKPEPPKSDPPQTDPKPAAPTPAPPPKSGKTFEIAASVDLPRIPSADGAAPAEAPSKVLGKINIDPKDTCFLAMFGGDKAMKGRNEYVLRNAQGGTAPRDWEILEKDSTGAETLIATLTLPAQELTFEWTPDGLKSASAGGLRNCALKITAGQEKPQIVALRTVSTAPPMTIENVEKSITARFNLESVPDGSALRMEPTIPNQKFIFESGGPDITKGDQWIYFGENKEQAPLGLKLDTAVTARGIQISADSFFLIPGEKPQKLTPALRKRLSVNDLQKQAINIGGKLDAMKKLKKEDQAKLQNEINLTDLARQNLDKAIQRVQKLDELVQQLNGNGKVHFRIYYDTGESQVDLVKTDDNAPPASK